MTSSAQWFGGQRDHFAAVRMFCFPHAGGGSIFFVPWRAALPGIDVCPVVLPGREHRINESPYTRMDDLMTGLLPALQPFLDRPFVLFGHSMGAAVAYETARRLTRNPPARILVSGRTAPHRICRQQRHRLPHRGFLDAVRDLGGTPQGVLDDPELQELFLPCLRADFELNETYLATPDGPLSCPVTALTGDADPEVTPEEMAEWGNLTSGSFQLRIFPGDHFYLKGPPPELSRVLLAEMDRSARSDPR